jgi:hypothetical protein
VSIASVSYDTDFAHRNFQDLNLLFTILFMFTQPNITLNDGNVIPQLGFGVAEAAPKRVYRGLESAGKTKGRGKS